MKKQSIAVIGVIAFVLAVAVGYALFTETIIVQGTATARGSFDLKFASIGTPNCPTAGGIPGYVDVAKRDGDENALNDCTAENLATIATGDNTVNITINKLQYPGASVTIPITITNAGSIPATLGTITETGLTTNSTIKVTYSGDATEHTTFAAGASRVLNVVVTWDENSNESAENVSFSIGLPYTQITN